MKIFLFLFLLVSPTLCQVEALQSQIQVSQISLKDKLSEAIPGSYLVLEQSKIFTFLHVYDKKGERLSLEEVTISGERFGQTRMSWRQWFESGAPGNTAWTLSQINLRTGKIEETYSFNHSGFVENGSDTFMTTLLNLTFQEMAPSERRHIGLPPGYGKPDHRPLWNPRLVVGGVTIAHVPFQAWKARWPADGSEMARRIIEVYLPERISDSSIQYPTYFPYWLEVEGKMGSAKIRVVDSGMEAHSPKTYFPHRKPQVLNQGNWQGDTYVITLKNPSHFTEFMVMAEESDAFFGKTLSLPCTVVDQENETLIQIKKEDMEKSLIFGESYRFLITPQEEPTALCETRHTFKFS